MVLFGFSNMISDIFEIVNDQGKKVTRIIVNMPEETRERTKSFAIRVEELHEQPLITSMDDFAPVEGEEYFVVPTTPKKSALIEFLRRTYQLQLTRLIHSTAHISPYARIGQGVFVGAKSVIGPGAVLMDYVFVGSGVTIGHDTVIHEYARLNPGSNIAGHVEILDSAIIGMGANVIEELVIGREAVVAAGAVVIKDVQERNMVAGIPAVVKKNYDA
jgi:sugar O-acyltransferase (sialic acid O-acetyltransferase NeuD family)